MLDIFDKAAATPPQPTSGGNIFDQAAAAPKAPANNPATTAPTTAPPASPFVTPGEGVYQMVNNEGATVPVSYSNVSKAAGAGHRFSTRQQLAQYARDHAADPVDEGRVNKYIDSLPWFDPVKIHLQLLQGIGHAAAQTFTGLDSEKMGHGVDGRIEQELQLAAETPTKGFGHVGEVAENVGEFFSGEELLGLLGKGIEALPLAERMKDAANLAQFLDKHKVIAKLLKVGTTAVKQGTIAGAQTYAKTGDQGAAVKTGVETGVVSAALPVGAGLWQGGKALVKGPAEAAAAQATKVRMAEEAAAATVRQTGTDVETYGTQAKAAIQKTLDDLNVHPDLAQRTLESTHDVTGAAAQMKKNVLNPIYDNLNELTGGKFRDLNAEVQASKTAARSGNPEAVAAYKNSLAKIDNLLDKETGGLPTDYLAKVKVAWRQQNVMEDLGWRLDRNFSGLPGKSQASEAQRGINGMGLRRDLLTSIKIYGRDTLDKTMGPEWLDTMDKIADRNMTDKQRAVFTGGIRTIAEELEKLQKAAPPLAAKEPGIVPQIGRRALAMTAGGAGAILTGHSPYWGIVAGEAGYETIHSVLNAIKTNPRIAQNFLFALDSGASAKKYGPLIATMIQRYETEASQQRQAEEEKQKGDKTQ